MEKLLEAGELPDMVNRINGALINYIKLSKLLVPYSYCSPPGSAQPSEKLVERASQTYS